MKHAVALLLALLLAYGLWVLSRRPSWQAPLGRLGGHALRVLALALGVAALLLFSFYQPSLKLL